MRTLMLTAAYAATAVVFITLFVAALGTVSVVIDGYAASHTACHLTR